MKKKIIVVDDEPDVAFTIEFNLKMFDDEYDIIIVDSGEKCLQLLDTDEKPDLILLDIMMPGMNGLDVFKKIKETPSHKDISIIFLTAKINQTSEDIDSYPGDDYIEKPYDPDDLRKRVKKLLNKN